MEETYEIDEVKGTITCKVCGMTSYNIYDVFEKYCGNCHQYHDILKIIQQQNVVDQLRILTSQKGK